MKILAINGSYRGEKGYTHFLIDRLFEGAVQAGADCEEVPLAGLKINRCLSCNRCHTDEHFLQCVYGEKDDVQAVFQKMAAADILVYATPIYVFGMSGLLKTFIDRMYGTGDVTDIRLSKSGLLFHHINTDICSKPFAALVCCDNLEPEMPRNALEYFKAYSRFMDAPQVGALVRNGGVLTGRGADPEREHQFPKIQRVYEAFQRAGGELAAYGRIAAATQRQASQDILPVPLFRLMLRIPIKPVKEKFVERAKQMRQLL